MNIVIAVLTILVGALETAGGLQELVAQGILNNRLYPLIGGTLGTVAGALLLSSGIALLRRSPTAVTLVRATALVSIPVFVLIGIVSPLAGKAVTLAGIVLPLLLLIYVRTSAFKSTFALSTQE